MFFKKKPSTEQIPVSTVVAMAVATVAVITAVGVAKWTLFIVEDLVALRQDFATLKNEQEQLKIQFDFWDTQVTKERTMIWKVYDELKAKEGASAQ